MNYLQNRFFDDYFDGFITDSFYNNMKCDIYEKDNNYHIEIDIPGFNKDEIQIEVKNNYLIVTAEKETSKDEDNEDIKYIHKGRNYEKYQRSFYYNNLDYNNINAQFNNGVLKITVPKKEEYNKRIIDIH